MERDPGGAESGPAQDALGGPMRDRLRRIPVFAGAIPSFDPDSAPEDPVELFAQWLDHAVDAGVPEPHVMNLATADAADRVDSRFLILKDVGPHGWSFATSAQSPKGRDLKDNARAALSCYWPPVGRQVRITGTAAPESSRTSAADFLARSPDARAEALVGGQSAPMDSVARHERELAEARARLAADPELVAPEWTLYTLRPDYVEFWQGAKDRNHIRLRYTATSAGAWERTLLRP
ncbi:pyridoxine/pyridoxamine 5'-phosphate oxidase [Streptomonospora salina]|uniref:Pyridoxamine 5'-phosphate oxidase n=1 Tax=Streptomonospora salina TaxID=104205 RepID=A0A841EC66_9ACTN|nr:pyridoxal 5'-phosphate synthase [Streptomonospora salina]MBB5998653.1 pyridoxamine 5'-phosphate oxidase [Streptomonospora salina]